MQYQYLRVFVLENDRPPILEASGMFPEKLTRTAYLQSVFGERIDFIHRKSQLVYIPVGAEQREPGPVLLGRIGRSLKERVNEPPEQGFAETELTTWRASNFLIDVGDYRDGQKIAMQSRGPVGKPLSVVTSLVNHINSVNSESGWSLEISPMTEKANFWTVVRDNRGEITSAVFNFVTPNVLRLRSELNASLKDARENNNAHRVGITLSNENGALDLEKENIKDAVDYVSEGGGTAKLKKGNKTVYDSEKDEKSIDLDDDEPIVSEKKSRWPDFVERIFK